MRPFGISAEFYDKFTEAYGIPVVGELTSLSDWVEMASCLTRHRIGDFVAALRFGV